MKDYAVIFVINAGVGEQKIGAAVGHQDQIRFRNGHVFQCLGQYRLFPNV